MPDPFVYLKATAVAAIVATLVLAVASLRRGRDSWLVTASAVAMVAGAASGYWTLSLRIGWPPASALDRLLVIVLPAALFVELIAAQDRVPEWAGWTLRVLVAVAAPRVLLHGSVYLTGEDRSTSEAMTMVFGSALVLCMVWAAVWRLNEISSGLSIPLCLGLTIWAAGLVVMMAAYIKGGTAAIPMAAALIATSLASRWIRRSEVKDTDEDVAGKRVRQVLPVIVTAGVIGLFGNVFIGRFFGDVSDGSAAVLMLTPLLCWASEVWPIRGRQPWVVGTIRMLLVITTLAATIAVAKQRFDREMAPLLSDTAHLALP